MNTIAYVYKWTHKPSFKWYIGSRTKKGCHPDDGYICSSKIVKPMIKSNPDEWTREVLFTGTPEEMCELEAELLQLFDAKNDSRSFNQHNGDGRFTTAGLIGELSPFYGKKHSEESIAKMTGKKHSLEYCAKQSVAMKGNTHRLGKTHSDETRNKMSVSRTGKNFPIVTCPHCNTEGGVNAMQRWHFDNCKSKG